MSLRLVRIDDRLIHGQVIAVWLRALGGKRIVIVDDATARDEFLREVLTLAAPYGVQVEVYDVASGAVRCIELAAAPEVVDLGGIGAGPGRKRIHRTISVSPDEIRDLQAIEQLGTRVEIQIVADDRPIPFHSVVSGE